MNKNWQPSAPLQNLQERAQFLHDIRQFFFQRNVREVDVPLLSQGTVTAPHLASFSLPENPTRYLQTSPEYAMKRLLAAGSGPIYYLGKAFRREEVGARHNPEFTMLEWYRPHWDHLQLIEEISALFQTLLECGSAQIVTYQALFEQYFDCQPHLASLAQLRELVASGGWLDPAVLMTLDKDALLDVLFTHKIEENLGQSSPVVVIDYPASQASLAKKRQVSSAIPYEVAERFEIYYQGMELANGYHELTCAEEQQQRFEEDLQKRKEAGLNLVPIDQNLMMALQAGMPGCAGVALGVDRLLMLKLKAKHISQVLPFDWERA